MKEYIVEITTPAQQDLLSIVLYIQDVLQEPVAAQSVLQRIRDEIQGLCYMPERYPLWEDEPWRSQGLRKMVVKKYVVLYLIAEHRQTVQIARVFYGRRDITTQLKKED